MSYHLSSVARVGACLLIQRNGNQCRIHTSKSMLLPKKPHIFNLYSNRLENKAVQYWNTFMKDLAESRKSYKTFSDQITASDLYSSSIRYLRHIQQSFLKIPLILKLHSINVVRMCTLQCEFVMAYKARRGQQIISLYCKIWDENALRKFLKTVQQHICKRGRAAFLSASCMSAFSWDKQRIPESELYEHLDELDYIHSLVEDTMTCTDCRMRQLVTVASQNIEYCQCKNATPPSKKSVDNWKPFIEGEDLLIWKRNEPCGMHSYKLYGNYDDVTAEDFLTVQIDVKNRKSWDPTAVELKVVDEDPDTNSDIVYWEMEWPRLFSNRDYVFTRRFVIDDDKKMILIVNQAVTHPDCPEKSEKFRVKDYWSFMVIRPYTDFDKPGIEFGLTYYDNPGMSVPSAVTAWVAMSGLPNFLQRLRGAARDVGLNRPRADPDPLPVPDNVPIPFVPTPPGPCIGSAASGDTYFQSFRFHRLFI